MAKRNLVPIDESYANLGEWFTGRPKWLQDAARRLLANGALTPADISELVLLCKKEAGSQAEELSHLQFNGISERAFKIAEPSVSIRLSAISDVKGINNLAPRKALQFGDKSLTIIYGLSGSGKSGYMRILKQVCGAKGIRPLLGNVFQERSGPKSCKINFNSAGTTKELNWNPQIGIHPELSAASLYDTDSAHVYVNEENEVTYEPPLLKMFRLLVEVCERIDSSLAAEIDKQVSAKPTIESALLSTTSSEWFNSITAETEEPEIASRCAWNEKLEEELRLLGQRLAEANPAEKAAALRKTKSHLQQLIVLLTRVQEEQSDQAFSKYLELKQDAERKRKVATIDANRVFENAPLEGVGSDSWRLLWEQAREFSERYAYKDQSFPKVGQDARCPLCQQELGAQAQERFVSFEAFIKGNLEVAARAAEKLYTEFFSHYLPVPNDDELASRLDLAGLSDGITRESTQRLCQSLRTRRSEFGTVASVTELTPIEGGEVLTSLTSSGDRLEGQAKLFDEDAKKDQREEITKRLKELTAQKWLSQNRPAIETEIARLRKVHGLKTAQRLAHTRVLSEKKAEMAEKLITEAFRERFEKELKLLGAARLKVEIIKSHTRKGQVFHQIKLKDAKQPAKAAEILSEGEFRVVSIAAFIADVEGKPADAPFVFDDPISSLDQPFEEATAKRLVDLAKDRQVIVFTHRLSMLVLLEDVAAKERIEPNTMSLRNEVWGAGEPDDIPIWAKKPEAIVNQLLGGRLAAAGKILSEQGRGAYDPIAKGICSDIRIAVERMVESHLLNDVVHRFRRSIQTQGRIEKLAKIKAEDCKFIDDFMTKYSRFEHSQSDELPVPPPEPDEIESDLRQIKDWFDEFKSRTVPAAPATVVSKSESQAA